MQAWLSTRVAAKVVGEVLAGAVVGAKKRVFSSNSLEVKIDRRRSLLPPPATFRLVKIM